jgi:hypothetical protein
MMKTKCLLTASCSQSGNWVGAPSLWIPYKNEGKLDNVGYLVYRNRMPKPARGVELVLCRSSDQFNTLQPFLTIQKELFSSPSIERCQLVIEEGKGVWLFVSHVCGNSGKWCVSVIYATSLQELVLFVSSPPTTSKSSYWRVLFTAEQIGTEGVKDPWVCHSLFNFYSSISSYEDPIYSIFISPSFIT